MYFKLTVCKDPFPWCGFNIEWPQWNYNEQSNSRHLFNKILQNPKLFWNRKKVQMRKCGLKNFIGISADVLCHTPCGVDVDVKTWNVKMWNYHNRCAKRRVGPFWSLEHGQLSKTLLCQTFWQISHFCEFLKNSNNSNNSNNSTNSNNFWQLRTTILTITLSLILTKGGL